MGTCAMWTSAQMDTLELYLCLKTATRPALEDWGLAMRLILLAYVELSIGWPSPLLVHVHITGLGTSATAISTNANVMVMFTNAFCVFCFRYCDCFANGEFCNNCNCTNCYNNLDHENDRQKAIKVRGLFPCPWDESCLACVFYASSKLWRGAEWVYNALISSHACKA